MLLGLSLKSYVLIFDYLLGYLTRTNEYLWMCRVLYYWRYDKWLYFYHITPTPLSHPYLSRPSPFPQTTSSFLHTSSLPYHTPAPPLPTLLSSECHMTLGSFKFIMSECCEFGDQEFCFYWLYIDLRKLVRPQHWCEYVKTKNDLFIFFSEYQCYKDLQT